MKAPLPLIYLDKDDIEAALPEPREMVAALESILQARAEGRAEGKSKTGIYTDDGNFYFALLAASRELGYSLCHNSMGTPLDRTVAGRHHIHSMEILSDFETAIPVAVMDGFWMVTWIPAAVTAVAAKRLARHDAKVLGFIAGGAQARTSLATMRTVRPIERVLVNDQRPETAEAFVAHARSLGLEAEAGDPRKVVSEADVLVTSVPNHPALKPFLDPSWLKPGSFTSMIDLARAWLPGLERLDRLVTDDHQQAKNQFADGRLKFGGPYDSDLTEIVSGARPPRGSDKERAAIIHPGHAIGILSLAALFHDRARAMGRGKPMKI